MPVRKLITLVILTLVPLGLQAQRVEVTLHTPPPGKLKYEHLWWCDLNNTGRARMVYLVGAVQEATRGRVFEAHTDSFLLAPGRRTVRLRDVRVHVDFTAPGYEAFVRRTGGIPEGEYIYSVTVMPDQLGGDTNRIIVRIPGPPRLLSPRDNATVEDRYPTFTWAAPMPPAARDVTYDLKIVRIMRGQTKEEAMRANVPSFAQDDIRATTLRYPARARSLEDGREYAWQVRALIEGFVIGVSEIWGFEMSLAGGIPGRGVDIYFADARETPSSVYHHRVLPPGDIVVYTRPSSNLYSFLLAPWAANKLYFVNANEYKIYVKDLSPGAPAEAGVYTHTTYVRDIAVGKDGLLYFSEATGAGGDGKIWRLEKSGGISLFYTVRLNKVDGSWAGDFTFDPEGVLWLSGGNRIPSSVYRVDVATDVVTKVFTDNSEAIKGLAFSDDGFLYYANFKTKIYRLNPATGARSVVYDNATRQWISDVGFKPAESGVNPPGGGIWVMPWGAGGTMLNQIDTAGRTDYTEGGLPMDDAPFGAYLGFRSGSSSAVPTTQIYYYRWLYQRDGEAGWHDFSEPVFVYYTKEIPLLPPAFVPFKLGPTDFGGKNLFRFKPHNPPSEPGATTYWPTTGFLGDIYSGFWNTEAGGLAAGKYWVKLEVYDSTGVKVDHNTGFKFAVPIGADPGGAINTRWALPGEIDAGGVKFALFVDNRPCSASIAAPMISGVGANDTCGFLRFNPADPTPVRVTFHASQPGMDAVFAFRIVRGIFTVDSSAVAYPDVDTLNAGAYVGDGNGNFQHDFLRATLLGPCTEAAFSENLYVYAKATTGWSTRISKFDRSYVRAFALSEQE
jgi:hypothetical protein